MPTESISARRRICWYARTAISAATQPPNPWPMTSTGPTSRPSRRSSPRKARSSMVSIQPGSSDWFTPGSDGTTARKCFAMASSNGGTGVSSWSP